MGIPLIKKYKRQKGRDWLPYLVYGLLSLGILGPLLLPGYILTLDMPFGPNESYTNYFYGFPEWLGVAASAPLSLLFPAAANIVPVWLLQKAILFLTFFLAGLGAHRLIPFKVVGSYFAGVLYMINPFTYVRFLAGQWGILWAYALTPFAIKAFIDLLEKGDRKSIAKVVTFSTLVCLVYIHGFFLLLLAFLILLLIKVIRQRRDRARILQTSKYVGISTAMFLGLNIYWLVPALTARGTVIEQIGWADLIIFGSKPSSAFGVVFDTASLYGFWRGGYVYANGILPFWWVLFVFILFLVIYGFVCNYKGKRAEPSLQYLHHEINLGWVVVAFGAIGTASFLLAVGSASEFTKPLFQWLWDHLFFFRGFRDSQKFIALLCLAYAYLGGLGVNELAKALRQQGQRLLRVGMMALIAIALVTPLVYSFTIFGFHGQLMVTDYPREWHEVNDYLNTDGDDFNVLFLPWHGWMDYDWLPNRDKRLANPAQHFFDQPVIRGDNVEVGGIYSQSTNPVSKYVEFLLTNRDKVDNFGELLAPLNVKYVVLVHEADHKRYDFLYEQEDLKIEMEKPGITLFSNEHPTAKVYGVDSVVYVNSLEEYLELSEKQDVMEHLYIIGSGPSDKSDAQTERLKFTEKNPVKYQVEGTSRRYTIFTVPQSVSTEHWQYNGNKPIKNLGVMPAFVSSPGGAEVIYTRFYHMYLPSYIISSIALAFILCYYFYSTSKKAALLRKKKTSDKNGSLSSYHY